MLTFRVLVGLIAGACLAAPGLAADLTKVDRSLVKEPGYKSTPKYCLLVFGPEARTRVWLVHDGDTLYVDRNGNGDLTEVGEKIAATQYKHVSLVEGVYDFEAGEITDGMLVHKSLNCIVMRLDPLAAEDDVKAFLAEHPSGRGYMVNGHIETPGRQGAGIGRRVEQSTSIRDSNGLLQFADRPETAPVIHFGGPLTVSLYDRPKLLIGRQKQLTLAIGTPGIGPGSTALASYEGLVPKDVHPKVEIVFPPERQESVRVRQLYELKGRC
jgi:hypothetical protein